PPRRAGRAGGERGSPGERQPRRRGSGDDELGLPPSAHGVVAGSGGAGCASVPVPYPPDVPSPSAASARTVLIWPEAVPTLSTVETLAERAGSLRMAPIRPFSRAEAGSPATTAPEPAAARGGARSATGV